MLRESVTENGLKVVCVERPYSPTVAIRVYVKLGSRDENDRNYGISHFIEHMLFKGTHKRNSLQIRKEIERLGGDIDAGTTKEYMVFSVVVPYKYWEVGIDVLSDILLDSVFNSGAIEKEKFVILDEIERRKDSRKIIWDLFSKTLWDGHPLSNSVLGTEEDVVRLDSEYVREYWKNHFSIKDSVVSIAGNIDFNKVFLAVKEKFNNTKNGESISRSAPPCRKEKRESFLEKDVYPTYIILGVPTVGMGDPDRCAIKLLNIILGGGSSSRLYQKIREEKGLVYTIYSTTMNYEDTGFLCIYTECNPSNVVQVTDLILDELKKIKDDGVSFNELDDAKRYYEGSLAIRFERNLRIAGIYGIETLLHKIEPFDEAIKKVYNVKRKDVARVANEYLDIEDYALVRVGRK